MEIQQEQLGDLPLLSHLIASSGLVTCIDKHYPTHGNWRGPSMGNLVKCWLMGIISECDHRLYTVEDWASEHLHTLRWAVNDAELTAKAFQDDRLGLVLERFSDEDTWISMVSEYNSGLIQLYELPQDIVRVDSVNVPSFRADEAGSLFQFGHRKSHQANLPHLKTMLVSLDPLALPLATFTVHGKRSDDQLYIPAIERAQKSLAPTGLIYVGDTKLCNLGNCGYLASTSNFYLGPLSEVQYNKIDLAISIEKALSDAASIQILYKEDPKTGLNVAFAKAYELPPRERFDPVSNCRWQERLVLIQDDVRAQSQRISLNERLKEAQKEIFERFLPKKRRLIWRTTPQHQAEAQAFIDKVVTKFKVKDMLNIKLVVGKEQNSLTPLHIEVEVNKQNVLNAELIFGWRIYATNAPSNRLLTKDILPRYREEYRIEQQFHKLLTKTTNLLPLYLKNENRIEALLRLLTLALQFVAIIQYEVREALEEQEEVLTDLIPGNKNRKVYKPTAELMLNRFSTINAVWIQLPNKNKQAVLLNFEPIHLKILQLLHFPENLYHKMICAFNNVNELLE